MFAEQGEENVRHPIALRFVIIMVDNISKYLTFNIMYYGLNDFKERKEKERNSYFTAVKS